MSRLNAGSAHHSCPVTARVLPTRLLHAVSNDPTLPLWPAGKRAYLLLDPSDVGGAVGDDRDAPAKVVVAPPSPQPLPATTTARRPQTFPDLLAALASARAECAAAQLLLLYHYTDAANASAILGSGLRMSTQVVDDLNGSIDDLAF